MAAALGVRQHVIGDRSGPVRRHALTADIAVPKGRGTERDGRRYSDHLRAGAEYHLPVLALA